MLKRNPTALAHPLWLCGFRPFFLAAAISAVGLIALWSAFLGHGLLLPRVPGGPFVWHAHELLFGFALAAVAGFALTAIPEFTGTAAVPARPVRLLAGLWLLGRASFWLSGVNSGWLGTPALAVAGFAHLALVAGLVALLAPRLLADPEKQHRSFLWALATFGFVIAGFYTDALLGNAPVRWLHASIGLLMILIVLALSRISMRIVNAALEERNESPDYRARPPKRNLAIVCIAAYTAAEFLAPGARLGGWLALAAAAALCHLQSDWHVGRALFRRWPLMLFAVYVLMAAGYGLIGFALLTGSDGISAGRHLLTVGAIGLSIYMVLNIAGRMHCGRELDERPWVPLGATVLFAAAVLRAATALPGAPVNFLLALSSLLWISVFAVWLWHMAPLLAGPRTDGGTGCEGIIEISTTANQG
ncbi:MAG: NnrS family protein [Flavobacteriales bacterium]|nr:MAG: NnrS family protein [Flavobacteriales bacterium]